MTDPGWSLTESPFHPGELAIQARLGIQERIDRMGRRFIREYITEQLQQFFAQLSYVIVGTVDESGNPWASILVGKPGFVSTPSDRTLQVNAKPLTGDPLSRNLVEGIDIGLLGIELENRRRNRINGVVSSINSDRFEVSVTQSFGNCPQYIQARSFEYVEIHEDKSQIAEINSFGTIEHNLIASADTFFIATAYQDKLAGVTKGADVSHRGGKPGFVRIDDASTLTIPDFHGNCYFNTLGNIELNPHAGLLFVDFIGGDLLYLTGKAEIIWSGADSIYAGAEQLIRFHLERGYLAKETLPLRWTPPEFSPQLKKTGSWQQK